MNPLYRAQCVALGYSVPQRVLSNADLSRMVDTSDAWITSRTGIRERRILSHGETLGDLARRSAESCLAQAGLDPELLDGIVVATSTGDHSMPAMANVLQQAIGASNAWGFDIINACNGFVAALATCVAMIESGRWRRLLLVAGDAMSPYIDYSDRNTCVLFGDGCAALLLEPGPGDGHGVQDILMGSDGSGAEALYIPASGSALRPTAETLARGDHYLKQDGPRVFNHAIRAMTASCEQLLARNTLSITDIDLFVPHQANMRIMRAVGERLHLQDGQLVANIDRYGNTTAATVPLALCSAQEEGRLNTGSRILITTFGAGYAWGAAYLTWGRS